MPKVYYYTIYIWPIYFIPILSSTFHHFYSYILNGHVEAFTEYYKQKKRFFCPHYSVLQYPHSNSYNFTEIQFSYGNLTGIIIIKKKSCLSRWRVCLDRNYIFLRLFFTYSRVYSRLSRYTSILRVQNIGAILHDYMQYSGSRMYSV